MRGCSSDQSGDSGDKQMAALQTNIIHLHWRCCHCPVQKYHFIEGSQWILLIVTRWSQDNMCWYDPKPTNKRLLQRSTSLIHRFHNWGGGCIQGKVNNSLFSLMMTCMMYLIFLFRIILPRLYALKFCVTVKWRGFLPFVKLVQIPKLSFVGAS